jgi:predicted membrane-bound spermidine synthase
MGKPFSSSARTDLGDLVASLTEGLATLVSRHIALARVEISAEVREAGSVLGQLALFIPFVFIGYVLLQAAFALLLARWLGGAGGFAVVGAANLLGGAYGLLQMRAYLQRQGRLSGTFKELQLSADRLAGSAKLEKSP